MAPAHSKITPPLRTQHETQRKRKLSKKITDEDFVGAESNAFTKRLKLAANNALKRQQTQSSVDDIEDEDRNSSLKACSTIEAVDKSDDIDIEAADKSDDVGIKEQYNVDSEEEGDGDDPKVVTNQVETAEEQRGESNKL
jgi:hypothetical protein